MFFKYKAIDQAGKQYNGYMEAPSVDSVRKQLTVQSLHVLTVKKAVLSNMQSKLRFTYADLALWSQSVHQLLQAGLELSQALNTLSENSNKKLARVSKIIKQKLDMGTALSAACAQSQMTDDKLFFSTLTLSEKTGNLQSTFKFLHQHYTFLVSFKEKCITALYYPIITLIMISPMLVYFLVSLVPAFAHMITEINGTLPTITKILYNISHAITNHYISLLSTGLGMTGTYIGLNTYYHVNHKLLLKIPFVKTIAHKYYLAIFFHTLAQLLEQNLSLVSALENVEQFIHDQYKTDISRIRKHLLSGHTIQQAIQTSNFLPEDSKHILCISSNVNKLAENSMQLSQLYQKQVENNIQTIIELIQPIILSTIGLMFLALIFGGIMPIYTAIAINM